MNKVKEMLARQGWIQEIKKRKLAVAAITTYAARYVPSHVKREIKIKAAVAGVPYFDVLCCNLAYEIAMISVTLSEGVHSDFWKGLAGLPTTRFGCTSFGIYDMAEARQGNCHFTPEVMHARCLDWPDPDGLLAKNTEILTMEGPAGKFYSVTFPGYYGILTGTAPGRFSVALNAVWNDDGASIGDAPTQLLREALEKCPNYDSAVRLLSSRRLVCGAMFTVVNGGLPSDGPQAVVIERTTGQYSIRNPIEVRPDLFVVCATNAFQIIGKKTEKIGGSEIGETSCQRHKTVMEESAALPKRVDVENVRTILDHVRLSCTIHSTVMRPALDEVDVRK